MFPGRCLDPWTTAYIDVDGWVCPCCRALWVGMGNVLERSFREIWNGEHYRRLRSCVNSDNPPDFCRECGMNTGINRGDDRFVEKLASQGIVLPDPLRVGVRGG